MAGYDSYIAGTEQTPYVNLRAWRNSCLFYNPGWQAMFHDKTTSKALLTEHYSWFLPTWDQYNTDIVRADSIRPFLLHHYGGLFLDLDVSCFRNVSSFLEGFDVVLQQSTEYWDHGVINCAMASVPQHPLWLEYARLLPITAREEDVLKRTGPPVLAKAVEKHFHLPETIPAGEHKDHQSSVLMVYPVGQFFVACIENDDACNQDFVRRLVSGDIPLLQLAGHHRFQHTWFKPAHEENLVQRLEVKPVR
ncbi:hypothetical protein WJX72_009027 [[Myrmecia] bisecta]|uniref:Glycosyltransferase n=1 Tax=[Myrmecia] bisecta TaxID=41462 RepID=A0AAW1QS21_9CHLO